MIKQYPPLGRGRARPYPCSAARPGPNGPIAGWGGAGRGVPSGPTGGHVGVARGGSAAARRLRAGAGGKQDGGGVSGAEAGGGPGRSRVRRECRRRRGRVAPRPPCMGWVPAPPLLLHAWGGRGGGRAARSPAASGTPGPGACGLRRFACPEFYGPPALRGPRRTAFGPESERGLPFGAGGAREAACGSQAGLGAPWRPVPTEVASCGGSAPGGSPTPETRPGPAAADRAG